jgi:hypothetical protein
MGTSMCMGEQSKSQGTQAGSPCQRSHGLLACDFALESDPVAYATGIGCIGPPGLIRATSKRVHAGHRIPQNPSLTRRAGMHR